jgi:ubiquinone/menaquinone biosynthesis C-methylase UbiE
MDNIDSPQQDNRLLKSRMSETVAANALLHGLLAETYEHNEPHFRPENREKVRQRLMEIAARLGTAGTMVDFGCGTGFLEELAPKDFKRIIAIDSTESMLMQLRRKQIPRVETILGTVEASGLSDSTADLVTGYSVLDHFYDTASVLGEAARLLRSGGVLYMDLLPNRTFWTAIKSVETYDGELDPIVSREVNEVKFHSRKMRDSFGIPVEVLAAAEPHKEERDGFNVDELHLQLMHAGFVEISIHHEWFLGEAHVLHADSVEQANNLSSHLKRLLPLTSHLFKYLWFTATKA